MGQSLAEVTVQRIHLTHRLLIQVAQDLTEGDFGWVPSPFAPPIGWHLWHIARWTDRLQASITMADQGSGNETWTSERFVARWQLDPEVLGVLQTGIGMEPQAAADLVHLVGQQPIVGYAQCTFAACDVALDRLDSAEMDKVRASICAFRVDVTKRAFAAPPPMKTVANDLAFHLSHSSRHLGMIEGLRGVLRLRGAGGV